MDKIIKDMIEAKCGSKIVDLRKQGYSEEYIRGYTSAYIDGFSEGCTHGLEKAIEIVNNKF